MHSTALLSALPLGAWGTLVVIRSTLCVCVPRNLYDTYYEYTLYTVTTPVAQTGTNLPIIQETQVPSLDQEDSPGEGNGNPLQCSCLKNPMDRGAWRAIVHVVAKSRTRLSD